MFEKIKCYKNLKKIDKFICGFKRLGEITQNDEMIRAANDVLCKNAVLRKKMRFNRKMAKHYNMEFLRQGF